MSGKRTTNNSTKTERPMNKDSETHMHEVFRRHFEAQFKPIKKRKQQLISTETIPPPAIEEFSEWSGISGSECDDIEVVDYTKTAEPNMKSSRAQQKAFMTAQPPALLEPAGRKKNPSAGEPSPEDMEDKHEMEHLKNDLKLQRLLQESHLLDRQSSLSHSGKHRHKAIDLRLQRLGAKSSVLTQDRMPMSHRKGILERAKEREDVRRKEARENGIILEKPSQPVRKKMKRREKGIDDPGMGTFKGGMLKLSKRDLASIKGPRR